MMKRLIIIDDDITFCQITRSFLSNHGWEVEITQDSKQFFEKLRSEDFCIAIVDLQIRTESGIDIIRILRKESPNIAILMCTAYGSIESAVEAMRLGACDYISKPVNYNEFLIKLNRIYHQKIKNTELKDLKKRCNLWVTFDDLIGRSESIRSVINLCRSIMNINSPVIICGETGTGKEIVARAIHFESNCKETPFIVVNCTTLQENLMESELFGHEKGAFTGAVSQKEGKIEIAEDGTLFLDEVGDLPVNLQKKLLRFLQEGEFERVGSTRVLKSNCRIIAATNRDLVSMIKEGTFREDLYYRLNVFHVQLPPLRRRKEDIPILVNHFIKKYCTKHNIDKPAISPTFLSQLNNMDFPGNIRELEHLIERSVVLSAGAAISITDNFHTNETGPSMHEDTINLTLSDYLQQHEKYYLSKSLERFDWDTKKVADLSGLTRKSIYEKIKRYDLKKI